MLFELVSEGSEREKSSLTRTTCLVDLSLCVVHVSVTWQPSWWGVPGICVHEASAVARYLLCLCMLALFVLAYRLFHTGVLLA